MPRNAFSRIGALSLTFFLLVGSGCTSSRLAQNNASIDTAEASKTTDGPKDGPKAFRSVIKADFEMDEGIFNVYQNDGSVWFEIPDEWLDREFLLVTRIARTADNIGYGGQKANTQVVRWERNENRILLRVVGFENQADEDDPIYQAVRNSNLEPIIKAFDIAAFNADTSGVVIDATDLFLDDVPSLGLQSSRRTSYQVRRLDRSRSYISSVKSFPENVEIRHLLTYEAANSPSNRSTNSISVEMAQSMLLLPAEPMKPRYCDDRVGLFSVRFTEYSSDQQKVENRCFVTRWKLEPSDPEAYARGELVEPVEPIVYYIDVNTPMKWREPLMQGVIDWQPAFEAAGFRNAIIAKMAPTAEEDPDFSPEDARYSVIRYFASSIQNASGPHVHDPRSGQILESDINWYHNVMNLLRNWYLIQTAAVNPAAQGATFEDEVMAELVRFVSAHEVGHTLGFQHNMGSSYAYSVAQLRDPVFTATHGTAPSIMDYARFNYVAQPGDGVTQFGPMVGDYDKWSTKWTYSWFDEDATPDDEAALLNEWVKERAGDYRYWFGRSVASDPRSQTENISNDEMEASRLGILNLQRILDRIPKWSAVDGQDFDELAELYQNVGTQYNRYIGHVVRNVGGIYETLKTSDQDGVVYEPVPADRQERAVQWMIDQVFTTPDWLIRPEIVQLLEAVGTINRVRGYQAGALSQLFNSQRFERMIETETVYGIEDSYTVSALFDDTRSAVFSELASRSSIDAYRRNLQRMYVARLGTLLEAEGDTGSDVAALVRAELSTLESMVDRAASGSSDAVTKAHLNDLSVRIENILDED